MSLFVSGSQMRMQIWHNYTFYTLHNFAHLFYDKPGCSKINLGFSQNANKQKKGIWLLSI